MLVVGLAAAMSSVTFTVAATESVVIILKPLALIFATSGRRSGTEKPMWLTVVPIEPPVGACIGRKNISTFGNLMISCPLAPNFASDAAERVDVELLLRVHVRGVQVVMSVHDRTFVADENLRACRRTAPRGRAPGWPEWWRGMTGMSASWGLLAERRLSG